jgi:hypothetical protein
MNRTTNERFSKRKSASRRASSNASGAFDSMGDSDRGDSNTNSFVE